MEAAYLVIIMVAFDSVDRVVSGVVLDLKTSNHIVCMSVMPL